MWMYALVIHGALRHNEKHQLRYKEARLLQSQTYTFTHSKKGRWSKRLSGARGRPCSESPAVLSLTLWEVWLHAIVQSKRATLSSNVLWDLTRPEARGKIRIQASCCVYCLNPNGGIWMCGLFLLPPLWMKEQVKIAQRASVHLWATAYLVLFNRAGNRAGARGRDRMNRKRGREHN